MPLTPKQRQFLKGKGHSLKPVIIIGKDRISKCVIDSIAKALDDHELIKVGLLETAELDRQETAELLSSELKADVVQVIGFKILLYKRRQKDPKIVLP